MEDKPENGETDAPVNEDLEKNSIPEVPTNPSVEVSLSNPKDTDAEMYPNICAFKDHFTLPIESSTIHYRGARGAARVIQSGEAQYVLEETIEETGRHDVSIRRIHDSSEGAKFLRIAYTIVTAFWTGFLFVFCLQVLLFLFLDLAIEVGSTEIQDEINWFALLGVIFSVFPFVYGLSTGLVIAGELHYPEFVNMAFKTKYSQKSTHSCIMLRYDSPGHYIKDVYSGHRLIRNFAFRKVEPVAVEWIFFAFFLLIPFLIACCSLLARSGSWWTITSLVWFFSVTAFYCIFAANVVWYEMKACWEVTRNRYHDDDDSFLHVVIRSLLLRQMTYYSGQRSISYISMGAIEDAEFTDSLRARSLAVKGTESESDGWRCKITKWDLLHKWGLYETLNEPERMFSIDDARDVRPYMTTHTWSLEKVFCRPKNSRYIAIVKGPGAITQAQMRSSMMCSVLGMFLIFFGVLAVLVSLSLGTAFTVLGVAASFIVFWPTFKGTTRLYKATAHLARVGKSRELEGEYHEPGEKAAAEANHDEVDGSAQQAPESEGVFFVNEKYRVTKATPRMCWIMFGVEACFFFVWPLAALLAVDNWTLALLFVFVAGISGVRYYISAAVVLRETGHLDLVDGKNEVERWRNMSRLNEIVGNITVGRSLGAWQAVLGFFGFISLALLLGAIGHQNETNANAVEAGMTYLPTAQFQYSQESSLRYPTCELTNDLAGSPLTTMVSYLRYYASLLVNRSNCP